MQLCEFLCLWPVRKIHFELNVFFNLVFFDLSICWPCFFLCIFSLFSRCLQGWLLWLLSLACNGQLFPLCSHGLSYVLFILFKQVHLGILYKNKPFKLYNFMTFNKFIELCNYHHNLILEYFHHLPKIPSLSPRQPLTYFLPL